MDPKGNFVEKPIETEWYSFQRTKTMLRVAKMHPLVYLRNFFVTLFEKNISLNRMEGIVEVYFLIWVMKIFFHNVSPSMHCFTSLGHIHIGMKGRSHLDNTLQ